MESTDRESGVDGQLTVSGQSVTDNLACLSDLKTKKKEPVNAHIFSFFTRLYTNYDTIFNNPPKTSSTHQTMQCVVFKRDLEVYD